MENSSIENEKDKMLWNEARKRVEFKKHLFVYLVVNIFLWLMWYFFTRQTISTGEEGIPWPLFTTLGWGFGVFWHFIGTYFMGNKYNQVEKEYKKLKEKMNQGDGK